MKVTCLKRIFSGRETKEIIVQREFELPFPPSKDISISTIREDTYSLEEIFFVRINCILDKFNPEDSWFLCETEPNMEIYNAIQNKTISRTIDAIVKDYVDRGWKLIK